MGVSATHLDWTLVPYVRKSFYKHWRDGVKYLLHDDPEKHDDAINVAEESIESKFYKNVGTEVYDYALDMTTREVRQGAEGLFHNLKIWA